MDLKFMKPLTPEDQESLAAAQDKGKGKGKGKARYSSPGLPPSPPAVVAGDIKVEVCSSPLPFFLSFFLSLLPLLPLAYCILGARFQGQCGLQEAALIILLICL